MQIAAPQRNTSLTHHSYGSLVKHFPEPPGKIYLLYGEKKVFDLSMRIASSALTRGTTVAVVDGCNRFDVHSIVRFAQQRRQNPDTLLNQIFVSRSFTCYQIEQAVVNRLPAFLSSQGSSTGMIFGLLDTMYDEQASLYEVRNILKRVLAALSEMKRSGASLLVVCQERTVWPEQRNRLFTTMKETMDRVYRLEVDENDQVRLLLEADRGSMHCPVRRNSAAGLPIPSEKDEISNRKMQNDNAKVKMI
ncbi:MAG: hypothetical protein V1799_01490 [bacterium]